MSNAGGSPKAGASTNGAADDDAYAVLKNRDFLLYVISRFIASFAQTMLAVAVSWDIYERTNSTLALGLVGLVQVIPMFLCTLHAGHVADNHSRKHVIIWMQVVVGICCAGLVAVSAIWPATGGGEVATSIAALFKITPVLLMLGCLFVFGAARTYLWAASMSFMPQLVPRSQFARAVTWNSGAFQIASVTGPMLFGKLVNFSHGAITVYILNFAGAFLCASMILLLRTHHKVAAREPMTMKNVAAGLKFVFNNKVILGSISLDLFAVLLGGATALLPVYARDILHVGASGLGWLNAALPLGSLLMSLVLIHRPPMRKAGMTLLWAVAGFGLATIGFGYSTVFWVSFLMLFLCGVTDYISVVVRQTLVQLQTPDAMRGRVSAVNMLFIGTSNQMGETESGFVAYYTTPKFAAVSGGIGTILVVIAAASQETGPPG
jgi:MFS family permease